MREAAKTNTIDIAKGLVKYVQLCVAGNDNRIVIKKLSGASKGRLCINPVGDRCTLFIDEGVCIAKSMHIIIGSQWAPVSDAAVKIGSHSTFNEAEITTFDSHSSIRIGSDCMVSFKVSIFNTDAHPVLNSETGKIINNAHELSIGDHCWIGYYATILKNVRLGKNCIVGWGAVVTSSVCKDAVPEGCVPAGNPAAIVKRGINRMRSRSDYYNI